MERYKLRILSAAQNDIQDIIDYVNTLSPQAAIGLYDAIIDAIATLAVMPTRCPLLQPTELRLKGYRALRVKNYMVFYVVKKRTVRIRRVLYAKRQFESLL